MSPPIGRTSRADATPTLKAGDTAPDVALTSHTGDAWTLAEARGQRVILAFFPFAFTPT